MLEVTQKSRARPATYTPRTTRGVHSQSTTRHNNDNDDDDDDDDATTTTTTTLLWRW
jgi:hypothetical protein